MENSSLILSAEIFERLVYFCFTLSEVLLSILKSSSQENLIALSILKASSSNLSSELPTHLIIFIFISVSPSNGSKSFHLYSELRSSL